jgi:hypothetical protein
MYTCINIHVYVYFNIYIYMYIDVGIDPVVDEPVMGGVPLIATGRDILR